MHEDISVCTEPYSEKKNEQPDGVYELKLVELIEEYRVTMLPVTKRVQRRRGKAARRTAYLGHWSRSIPSEIQSRPCRRLAGMMTPRGVGTARRPPSGQWR